MLAVIILGGCASGPRAGAPVANSAAPTVATVDPTSPAPPSTTTRATTTTLATTTTTLAPAPVGPPYPITESSVVLVDRSRPTVSHGVTLADSRTLTTLIWSPTGDRRWPLLVFAHGFDVSPSPYFSLLQAWAAQGYVVAAPEFPLTDPDLAGAHLDENDIQQQPGDMRFVIDSLVAPGSRYAAGIDPSRVAIAGHSDGAETALGLAAEPTPPGEPAVRAVIAMSVSPLVGVSHTVNPPILVTQGDQDTINPESEGIQAYDEASSPKYLAILHGAGHLPPLEAGSPWLSALEALTEAFLSTYVEGVGDARTVIGAGSRPPLISIQTG